MNHNSFLKFLVLCFLLLVGCGCSEQKSQLYYESEIGEIGPIIDVRDVTINEKNKTFVTVFEHLYSKVYKVTGGSKCVYTLKSKNYIWVPKLPDNCDK